MPAVRFPGLQHAPAPFRRRRRTPYSVQSRNSSKVPDLSDQLALFAASSLEPEGLRYAPEFVSPATEQQLIARIAALPMRPFQFGQYEGKRRVASFGFSYDYSLRRLRDADPIPD